MTAPNGVTTTETYDDLNRLTALNHTAGANTLSANQYTYNDVHNITNWTNAAGTHDYAYDLVDRLTAATHSAQANENYTYDEVGNRIKSADLGYEYEPFNKLVKTDVASYSYDNNGNLTAKKDGQGETLFSWNEENQLTQVKPASGGRVTYKYDALGRRIQRSSSSANERYVYDGQDVLLDPLSDRFKQKQSLIVLPYDELPMSKWNGNPYNLDGGNGGRSEDDGAYFLLPYWMGRYHKLISE